MSHRNPEVFADGVAADAVMEVADQARTTFVRCLSHRYNNDIERAMGKCIGALETGGHSSTGAGHQN
eukprot:2943696-Amphidinium_carterae.1